LSNTLYFEFIQPSNPQQQSISSPAKKKKKKSYGVTIPIDDYNGPSRIWDKYTTPEKQFPCYVSNEALMIDKPTTEGILFQRPEKTGTTTMVGVIMRLAHNRAMPYPTNINVDKTKFRYCKHRAMHGTARHYQYNQRDKQKSFLFSLIRDPTSKAVSRFFHFSVTVYQIDPTDINFIRDLQGRHNARSLLNDLIIDPSVELYKQVPKNSTVALPGPGSFMLPALEYNKVVQDILDEYDFIAITERMDESLVVMKYLLNLTLEEILYIKPARSAGSFSNGPDKRHCIYIHPTFITNGVEQYLQSEDWKRRVEGDELLYQAAYRSLDLTIEKIGRAKVEKTLSKFQKLKDYAATKCQGKVRSMCDDGGHPLPQENRTCYIWGEGCDYQCLNALTIPSELLIEDEE
jgi:hypothetical protein